MPRTRRVDVKHRWIQLVQSVLEEAGLSVQPPRLALTSQTVSLPPDVEATEDDFERSEIVRILGKQRDDHPFGALLVTGRFTRHHIGSTVFCVASDATDQETYWSAPRLRGSWDVRPVDLRNHLLETLEERQKVMLLEATAPRGPYDFRRPYGVTSIWS